MIDTQVTGDLQGDTGALQEEELLRGALLLLLSILVFLHIFINLSFVYLFWKFMETRKRKQNMFLWNIILFYMFSSSSTFIPDIEAGGVGAAAAAYHVVQYDTVVVIAGAVAVAGVLWEDMLLHRHALRGGGHHHLQGVGVPQNQYHPLAHNLHNSLGVLAGRSRVPQVLLVGQALFPTVTDLQILDAIKSVHYCIITKTCKKILLLDN